jgi:DNA polymerase-3 subunit epsilon
MGSYDWVAQEFWGEEGRPAVFTVFDLETTGLDPKKEKIVEIGAVKFDRRGPIGRFSVLVDPGVPMPAEASRINGITDAMLAGKPSLDLVLPDFLRFIGDSPIIAHNAPFDCSFVDAALAERFERARKARPEDAAQGSLLDAASDAPAEAPKWAPPFPALPNRVIDTRIYAKEAFPGRWKYSLQELAKYLGIDALEAHRAEDDARVCMELFVKCAERGAGKEVAVFG